MVPRLTIRAFSDDQYILDKVLYSNFYKLKKFKEDGSDVVVDIGAHAGFFSFNAAGMGATVHSFEPFEYNFEALIENTKDFPNVKRYMMGVFQEPCWIEFYYPEPAEDSPIFNFSDIQIELSDEKKRSHRCYCQPLGRIIEGLGYDKIELLKLSIGYSEPQLLIACDPVQLKKCNYICGQTSESPEQMQTCLDHMKNLGFDSFLSSPEQGKILFIFAKENVDKRFNLTINKYAALPVSTPQNQKNS